MTIKRVTAAFVTCSAMLLSSCGGGGGDSGGDGSGGSLANFAGEMDSPAAVDGPVSAARFNHPQGLAADRAGNVYVADRLNHTIRAITSSGVVTTLAGTPGMPGSADGNGPSASFNFPSGVATDNAGNVYVADSGSNTIRMVTPAGVVTTLAGAAGTAGSADGNGPSARFNFPSGVATDNAGNVYVADSGSNTIRMVTPAGVVTTLAGAAGAAGSADGTGLAASFNFQSFFAGLATDSSGNVYVADSNNHTVRKIAAGGVVTTLAGAPGVLGKQDGTGTAARLCQPQGIDSDDSGNLYVVSCNTVRKITPAGVVTTVAGTGGPDWAPGPLPGKIPFPIGIAVDGSSLYVTFLSAIAVVRNRP